MAAKKDTLSNALLNAVLRGISYSSPASVFVALYTAAPTNTTQGTEVSATGTGYTRVAVTFDPAASGATANTGAVTWAAATALWGTVIGVAICSSNVVGTDDQLYYGVLDVAVAIDVPDNPNFAIGALEVTES